MRNCQSHGGIGDIAELGVRDGFEMVGNMVRSCAVRALAHLASRSTDVVLYRLIISPCVIDYFGVQVL